MGEHPILAIFVAQKKRLFLEIMIDKVINLSLPTMDEI
jgi:hypothetical protein